jgi:hypothetical protein
MSSDDWHRRPLKPERSMKPLIASLSTWLGRLVWVD